MINSAAMNTGRHDQPMQPIFSVDPGLDPPVTALDDYMTYCEEKDTSATVGGFQEYVRNQLHLSNHL